MKKLFVLLIILLGAMPAIAMELSLESVEVSPEVQATLADLTKDVHPFVRAYYYGDGISALEEARKPGISIHDEVFAGKTLLGIAMEDENGAVVRWCLSEGAYGSSLLHEAVVDLNLKRVKFLVIDCKVDVKSKSYFGYTALHWATVGKNNSLDIVKFLVVSGADVNAKDVDGLTPLHHAVLSDDLEAVKFLVLEAQANIFLQDKDGRTAVDKGTKEIAKFLKEQKEIQSKTKAAQAMVAPAIKAKL